MLACTPLWQRLNNKPAISYLDGSNSDLKFILVNFIDISVRAGGTAINDGDTLDFGTTTENTPVSIPITIQNSGDSALDLTTLSLPSGFSLTGCVFVCRRFRRQYESFRSPGCAQYRHLFG